MKIDEKTRELLEGQRLFFKEQIEKIDKLIGIPNPQGDLFGGMTQGEAEKEKHDKKMSPGLVKISAIFGRRADTLPNKAEIALYNDLGKRMGKETLYEQIEVIERFYGFRKKAIERNETNLWQTSIVRLLKNWDEANDRANVYLESKPQTIEKKEAKVTEPDSEWRKVAFDIFSGKGLEWWEEEPWAKLPADVQREIIENL